MDKRVVLLLENIGLAVLVAVFTVFINFDPAKITDWRTWAIGFGASLVRTAAAAGLATLNTWRVARQSNV